MSIHTIMNMITVTITTMTMDTNIHTIMITNTVTTTSTTTTMAMTTTMEVAAAMIALPTTTTSMNLYTTTRPIHMKRIWPVIRTIANVLPAIPMKSIAITAAKAWPTANAVCRTPTT